MKLFEYKFVEDFGKEHYFFFLKGEKYTLVQFSIGWNDYPGGFYLHLTSGMGKLFGSIFSLYRLDIGLDLIGRNWYPQYFEDQPEPPDL